MSKLADYTVGIVIVLAHFVIMAVHEWRLNADSRALFEPPRG